MDYDLFYKELEKQKIRPDRKQDKDIKEGWQELKDIYDKIQSTDKEIDEMVFDLYGLTEEERKIVLESIDG